MVDAGAPSVAAKKSVGQLESPQGAVTLERDGKPPRAAAAEPLFPGDVIETGEDGSAVLRFSGDRVVELGAEGRFELGLDGSGLMLNVARGFVLTRVKASGNGKPAAEKEGEVLLTISTPFGLTRVGNAELSMKVDESSADVDVKVGEIELVSRSGQVSKLGAGKKGMLGEARELPEIALTVVVAATGKGEIKTKNAKSFVAINPKKPPALKAGDVVRVKDGRLSLAPEGSDARLALLKGAEVGIGESRKGPGKETTSLDVKKGEVEVSAPEGQSTRVAVVGGVTLVSDLGGQYSLRRTGSGFDIDALAGDLTIEREGQPALNVPGGQSASVPLKGDAAVRSATKEGVVLPSRQGLKVFHQSLKQVSVTWDDDGKDGGDYRVQLATDPSFTNVVRDGVVHDNFFTVPMPPKGVWYWRVTQGDQEKAKGSATFAPEPRTQDLSRLKNIVPEGAETTTIFFQDKDKPPVVNFTWAKADGASKYAVKVYREGQLSSPVAERTVTETQVALPENTLLEGKYLWSVTPLDAKGAELKGGRMNKLHMVFDNAVAALLIKTPRNGDAGGKSVNAVGIAPVGSKLFINGKSVALDEQARFDTSVAPAAGGRIVFRLLHAGAESYTVRTVRGR